MVSTPVKQGNAKTRDNNAVKEVAVSDQEQDIPIHDTNPQGKSINLLLQHAPHTTPVAQQEDATTNGLQSPQLCMNFNVQEILKDFSTLVSTPPPQDLPHASLMAQDDDAAVTDQLQESSQAELEHQQAPSTKQAPSPTLHPTKHLGMPIQEQHHPPNSTQKALTSCLAKGGNIKECLPDYIPSANTGINVST